MSLIPQEPFRYIEGARREMERLFGTSLFREEPRIDIYEKDEAVIASCEIPGLKSKEDIRIEIGENMLLSLIHIFRSTGTGYWRSVL